MLANQEIHCPGDFTSVPTGFRTMSQHWVRRQREELGSGQAFGALCAAQENFRQACAFYSLLKLLQRGFPGGSVVKNPPPNAGDMGLIPGSGRFPAGGNGNPLQHSWLENPMDRGAWWALVHRVAKSWIQVKWVSTRTHTHIIMIKFEYLNLGSEYWENTEFVIIIIILTA